MEIGKQIKTHRAKFGLSQEEFADKIFVTRQTVSNWENDKSYPDINSLVLMAEVFGVSLDSLVKGDIEEMNEKIKTEDIEYLNKANRRLTLAFVWDFFMLVPLLKLFGITQVTSNTQFFFKYSSRNARIPLFDDETYCKMYV